MNKYLTLLFFLLCGVSAFAQTQVVFTNVKLNKMITVSPGQTLVLLYKGYLGQTEMIKNMVTEISDSTITIAITPTSLNFWSNKNKVEQNYKCIRIKDIKGFRRISIGRLLFKNVLTLGAVIGTYAILNNINKGKPGNLGRDLLISLGIGIGIKTSVDLMFPENIKYLMEEGWQTTVIHQ